MIAPTLLSVLYGAENSRSKPKKRSHTDEQSIRRARKMLYSGFPVALEITKVDIKAT